MLSDNATMRYNIH